MTIQSISTGVGIKNGVTAVAYPIFVVAKVKGNGLEPDRIELFIYQQNICRLQGNHRIPFRLQFDDE